MMRFQSLVEANYDGEAQRYVRQSKMQTGNLSRLFDFAAPFLRRTSPQTVLDVGCGTGDAAAEVQVRALFPLEGYLGVDLSAEMIALAAARHSAPNVSFIRADAEQLPAGDGTIDIVISNSALHWLNQPALGVTPQQAFNEISRCLRPGGVFAASIAGLGSGRRFQAAYHRVMRAALESGDAGFDNALFLHDPIGCMALHEAVDMTTASGLTVHSADFVFEPVTFDSPAHYCDAVRAYGYLAFLAAAPASRREDIWTDITRDFAADAGPGPYRHDQYMCYVTARKPGR